MRTHICTLMFIGYAATSAHADCSAELASVLEAHKTAGPYHVSMISTFGDKSHSMEVDVILPSSFHMKSKEMEMIMLKSGAWMKQGGAWKKMPAVVSNMTAGMIDEGMKKGIKGVKNPTCLGAQSYEGQSYTAYAYDSSGSAMGIKSTSHVTIYIGGNGKPSWLVVNGKAMGKPSRTVQKITFDPSITIAAPN